VPGGAGTAPALGITAQDGSMLILLGGEPQLDRVAEVGLLLPLLAAAFRDERAALTATGQADVAREAAAQASMLADALDTARRELQHALGEAEAARRRLGFLAEASATLAASLDYETTLQTVARLAVPTLADVCFFDVVTDGETIQRVAWAHTDPAQQERVPRYVPPRPLGDHPAGRTLLGGQARLVAEVTDAWMQATATSPEHLQFLRDLGVRSLMRVPLVARERPIGVLTFGLAGSGRRYTPADLVLAEELARRAALAVDHAWLYHQLQQGVRTRDEFLLSASHDLKNPLAAIQGQAQLLRRRATRAGALDGERLLKGLAPIENSTRMMAQLLDEWSDVARLQMGEPLHLDRRSTDLVALARQIAGVQQPMTESHQIVVEAAVDELVGPWDTVRLARVLGNLLGNAVKYSPAGGTITVALGRAEGAWAMLAVRDQGVGIPAADLPHIFERFHRGSNVAGHIAGTGIGLATVRQIVEQHGGTITVESWPDKGPALVVLDMILPVLDGEGVVAGLRATFGVPPPVLVISADGRGAEKARQVGAFAFLSKPLELDDLVATVQRALESS
jgi:signal transduction histidine kinase